MNIRPFESTLVVHFSAARIDLVESRRDDLTATATYDAEIDAVAVDLDDSQYEGSDEILPGFIVDRDEDGFTRGLEFLNASRFFLGGGDFERSKARDPALIRACRLRSFVASCDRRMDRGCEAAELTFG